MKTERDLEVLEKELNMQTQRIGMEYEKGLQEMEQENRIIEDKHER